MDHASIAIMAPPSITTLRVLRAFLDDPRASCYGLELIDRIGIRAGALYPILGRLEAEGWLVGEWEDIDEKSEGRRRRRYYRLSELGQRSARALLAETSRMLRPPPCAAQVLPRRRVVHP